MFRTNAFAICFLFTFLVACDKAPKPLEISNVLEIDATVVSVDVPSRTLVLRGPDGNEIAFSVGPDVRNLAQVEAGDSLRVQYFTGYLFSIAEPGNAGADIEIDAARAMAGERPGAAYSAIMRSTVEILSVAKDGKAVSFRDKEGVLQSIDVVRPEGQAFARKLKQGDLVDIQYAEAVAVSIEAAESGS